MPAAEPRGGYLVGYTDRLDPVPGDHVAVMVESDESRDVTFELVRLGAGRRDGAVREELVTSFGTAAVGPQRTSRGSCVVVEQAAALAGPAPVMVSITVSPTRPARHQVIAAQRAGTSGWTVGLDESGRPWVGIDDGADAVVAVGDRPLVDGAWYRLRAGSPREGVVELDVLPLRPGPAWRATSSAVAASSGRATGATLRLLAAPLWFAALPDAAGGWGDGFDGKLERPSVHRPGADGDERPPLAEWDLGVEGWGTPPDRRRVSATAGPAGVDLSGECRNAPLRAVTGSGWTGVEQDFRAVPDEYSAIHFHADDLDDCGWPAALDAALPGDLDSGVYAIRVTAADLVDRLPLFVRPRAPRHDVALLVPTVSYLAYANDHPASDGQMCQAVASSTPVLRPTDLLLHEHREWGLSCYDVHADGSGVAFSSLRRPLLNMRPTHEYHIGAWQLPADLAIVQWLADADIGVDVITDHHLHEHGAAALAPYRAVLTGTHPEYFTTAMLLGVERWVDAGGRLVYLGANGFYWRTAIDPARPWLIELRRGHAGSRAWESAPGETHLESTGERGGLWRHLGRPPQRLTGVGYAAQGFDTCSGYRRLAASRDPRAAFVFDGVDGDTFGTTGAIGGGAAGQEVDRCDVGLGTPDDALVLATSDGLSTGYLRCVEELGFSVAGTSSLHDPAVRADVVYHVKPGGGAVFATGSIAWSAALGVDAGVDRITRNVIARFRDPEPLPW